MRFFTFFAFGLFLSILLSFSLIVSADYASEHTALADFYYAMGGVDGDLKDWDLSQNHCYFSGITCDGSADNLVYSIDFNYHSNLTGTLPESIGNFPQLYSLTLGEVQLSGTIPSTIGQLTNLEELELNYSFLTGTIPSTIGQLIKLHGLYLNGNQLSGTIPSQLGQLTQLYQIYLSGNKLTGTIPVELAQLTLVHYFDLSHNELTGTIPIEFSQLPTVYFFALNNNQLTGTIPVEYAQLTSTFYIWFQSNQLTGTVPDSFCSLPHIFGAIFNDNLLCGSVPDCCDSSNFICEYTSCDTCGNGQLEADETCDGSAHCETDCTCSVGFGDCDGLNENGCETDLLTSPSSCGSCSNNCMTKNHVSSATCFNGTCQITGCDSNGGHFSDCNNKGFDGCEINTDVNSNNCGSCGRSCSNFFPNANSNPCKAGSCSLLSCKPGFSNCDKNDANGCEAAMNSSTTCGSCSTNCLSAPNVKAATCSNKICTITWCAKGYSDCDKQGFNGCETQIGTDINNCGLCGHKCSSLPHVKTTTCTSGVCHVSKCATGYCNANNIASDGCEIAC